jgi:hypothetical protein
MLINAELLKPTKLNPANAFWVSKEQNFNPTNICASTVFCLENEELNQIKSFLLFSVY